MANKAGIGGSKTTIGGIILAIIVGALYFGNGGAIDLEEGAEAVTEDDGKEKFFGLVDYLPTLTEGKIKIEHDNYTLSYSDEHKQAEWVAYELTRNKVENVTASRGHLGFSPDPNLPDWIEGVVSNDYTNSGYDRGHLLPAQDMASDAMAMEETFYMTNVSPQDPDFNRGIWKSLENQVREWAQAFDNIYVITGPILTQRAKKRFPKNKKSIPVPQSYYKIILDFHGSDIKAIAFLMKNEESNYPLISFATTIDDIEKETGIDFFPKLPDNIENKLESEVDIASWALTRDAYSVNLDSMWSEVDAANELD